MWSLRQWWRAGERPGDTVYRRSWLVLVLTFSGMVALYWAAPPLRTWYGAGAMLGCCFRALAERRRAVIFSGNTLRLRPAFRAAAAVDLADVVSFEPCQVSSPYLLRGRAVSGLLLRLRSGQSIAVPLDFPRKLEISSRLAAAADGRLS